MMDGVSVCCVCRLKEIEMSEHDAKLYRELMSHVQQQIQILRVMLDNIEV